VEPRSGGLAPWLLLPVGGLLVLLLAISRLPGSDCDGLEDPTNTAEVVLIALAALASLGCVGAASLRVVSLVRAGRGPTRLLGVAAAGFLATVILGALLADDFSGSDLFWALTFFGVAITGVLLAVLIVAWIGRRRPDEAGLLVPFYLLGVALFVYPFLTAFALAINSGAFC
jgi:hypothetical protein